MENSGSKIIASMAKKVTRQPWIAKIPSNNLAIESLMEELIERIEKMSVEVRRTSPGAKLSAKTLSELKKIDKDLQMFLGVPNINKERLGVVRELLKDLKEDVESLQWRKVQLENAERFQQMQKDDLSRVKGEVELLQQLELKLMKEYVSALGEIIGKLKEELGNLQKQLVEVEAKIVKIDVEIADLEEKIEEVEKEIKSVSIDFFAGVSNALRKFDISDLSQGDKEEIEMFARSARDPERHVGISEEANLQLQADNIMRTIVVHVERDARSLGKTKEQIAEIENEIKRIGGALAYVTMLSGSSEEVKDLSEELAQKEVERKRLEVKRDELKAQVEEHIDLIDGLENQPVNKETVERAMELAEEQGIVLPESEQERVLETPGKH